MSRKNKTFKKSFFDFNTVYLSHFNDLKNITLARFKHENVPDGINVRFLENSLITFGYCINFFDEMMGKYLSLDGTLSGYNVYNEPEIFNINAQTGYHANRTSVDAVIMYNNLTRCGEIPVIQEYAEILTRIDMAIKVNTNAQKTPILIKCPDSQRLTMLNVYESYDGNEPIIIGDKEVLSQSNFTVLKTDAPYVCDKLYDLKVKYQNEFLTKIGVANISVEKRERLIRDEVNRLQGGTLMHRESPLQSRVEAIEKFNEMFGTDWKVSFADMNESKSERSENGVNIHDGTALDS